MNFSSNIKTQQVSELRNFCPEYQNVARILPRFLHKIENAAKLKNTTNCRKFSNATNVKVPQKFHFCPTFSFLPTFSLVFFKICEVIVLSYRWIWLLGRYCRTRNTTYSINHDSLVSRCNSFYPSSVCITTPYNLNLPGTLPSFPLSASFISPNLAGNSTAPSGT